MNGWKRERQQGQSLVLIAFAAVALVAAVALAVDGSAAYAQRRRVQNAADAGAIAGTYRLYQKQLNKHYTPADQSQIRRDINLAVQSHGIPDTDADPNNDVNGNVVVYLTDEKGAVISENGQACQLQGSCTGAMGKAWGIKVAATQPFTTYFAGIIGWNQMTVGANAVAVTHAGSTAKDEKFALFGMDAQGCGGEAVNVTGSNWNITASVHANGDVHLTGSTGQVQGNITYSGTGKCGNGKGSCSGFATGEVKQIPGGINNLSVPDFTKLTALVQQKANAGLYGQILPAQNLKNGDVAVIGSPLKPYTVINGNLDINNGAIVTIYGIVYVKGNITMNASSLTIAQAPVNSGGSPGWSSAVCGGGSLQRMTLLSDGEIQVVQAGSTFVAAPFIDPTEELLKENTIMFYSNLNRALGGGGNACSTDVISFSASANNIFGSIVAPYGRVGISGSQNVIKGAIIANSIDISGSNSTIDYRKECFPPQPDYIELLQ